MKTIEQDPRLPGWINWLLNQWPFCLDKDSILSAGWSWGPWGFVRTPDYSLFWNGYLFVRLALPFGVFLHFRHPKLKRYLQILFGWKLNGRITTLGGPLITPFVWWFFGWHWALASLVLWPTYRTLTDESSARGVLGPNYGQATGMEWGPK